MEILAIALVAYLIASPDRVSLALTRGLFGATQGAVTGKTPKSRKPSPRHKAMSAGWREGIAAAKERRDAGRDLWTRGTRAAGRAKGGAVSLGRGIHDTIQAHRAQPDDPDDVTSPDAVPSRRGWTMPRLVRRPRTAPTSDASVAVVDEDGNDVTSGEDNTAEPAAEPSPDSGDAEPETKPAPAPVSDPAPAATPAVEEPTTPLATITAIRTTPNGDTAMPQQTELGNVDELAAETKTMENVFTDLAAAIDRAKKWGLNLPDRWSAANWGTKGLDRAVMDLSEEVAGIKMPALESFASVRARIAEARTLGEAADAVQAHGKTEAFRSN